MALAAIGSGFALGVPSHEVFAIDYLTVEQAQRLAFKDATVFVPMPLALSEEQREAIEDVSDVEVEGETLHIWKAMNGDASLGYFITDAVIGKHLLIDYTVAVSPMAEVLRVEILTYRENYGGEVRNPDWLKSFVGKRAGDLFKIKKDIPHISGATLSSNHIAEGVRRILASLKIAAAIPVTTNDESAMQDKSNA